MSIGTAIALGQLGLGLYGALSQGRQAQKAYNQQQGAIDQQRAMMAFQRDQYANELNYRRQQDALNRATAQQERQQAFDMYFANNKKLQDERDYFIQRQEYIDKVAAQERADALGMMLQNQSIAAEERDFALAELARAQQIAQGERDEELRIFYDNQFRAEAERQYSIDQFERAQGIARAERDQEAALRDALDSQIVRFQDELRNVQEGLGDIRRLDPLTQEYIDSQVGRYRDTAKDSYDEVIEQMASMNEADLRRRGIAATDPGDTRSRMAQRLADDLAATQMQAEQQALAYISGERGLLFDDIQQDIATRNAILGETANVGLAGYDQRRGLMNALPTENVGAPIGIGSAILNGQFRSANTSGPLAVNSAQFTGGLTSGIGQQLSMPSAVQTFNLPTSQTSAYGAPSEMLSGLTSGYGDIASTYGTMGNNAATRSGQGFEVMGTALSDFGGYLDDRPMSNYTGPSYREIQQINARNPGATSRGGYP